MIKHALRLSTILVLGIATAHQAFASGYEKSIMWGGRSAGLAGIASPWIGGSQALYFNPAGLVKDETGQDVTFAVSPMMAQFKGPITDDNSEQTSSQPLTTPLGLVYGNTLNDRIGFGVGYYISGGSKASFDDIDFGGFTGDVQTDITIAELAAGVAYKVSDDLKVGAAYRMVMAQANFAFVQRAGANFVNLKLTDLKDNNSPGFRFGVQYKLTDATQLGLNYRSQVDLAATGRVGGTASAGTGVVTDAEATANTTFPQQLSLGAQHTFNDVWKGFAEYGWIQYSKVEKVSIDTSTVAGGAIPINDPEVIQNWKDQHNIRMAAEYTGCHMPIRFGYGWTSQVSDTDFARASFTPPGQGHTFTLGSGYGFDFSGNNMNLDWAYEYTVVSGAGTGADAGATGTGTDIREGKYRVDSHAVHLAATYSF